MILQISTDMKEFFVVGLSDGKELAELPDSLSPTRYPTQEKAYSAIVKLAKSCCTYGLCDNPMCDIDNYVVIRVRQTTTKTLMS